MLFTQGQKILPVIDTGEFLPPISKWTSIAGIILVGTVGAGTGLASWIKYNVTVKAPASVRPAGDIRLVQPEIEGTVKTVLVKENQVVKKGDAIAKLDDEQFQIKKSQLQGEIQQGKLQIIQIEAQIRTLDSQAMAESSVIDRTIASAKADLERNQRELQERQITTQSELEASQANLRRELVALAKAREELKFAQRDKATFQALAREGAIAGRQADQSELAVEQAQATLAAQQQAVDIARARIQTAKATINPSTATVDIAQERIAQEVARGRATIATLHKEKQALTQQKLQVENQIMQAEKELRQIDNQMKSTVIRATNDGIIFKLNLRNPGQVVRASESIAEIVPQDAPLVLKASIPPAEKQKIEPGQVVQLRLNACPYPDYGTLKGKVTSVSPDVITAQASASPIGGSFFEVTVTPESKSFGQQNKTCKIQPGMEAQADIITKEETALQFILRKARLTTDL